MLYSWVMSCSAVKGTLILTTSPSCSLTSPCSLTSSCSPLTPPRSSVGVTSSPLATAGASPK